MTVNLRLRPPAISSTFFAALRGIAKNKPAGWIVTDDQPDISTTRRLQHSSNVIVDLAADPYDKQHVVVTTNPAQPKELDPLLHLLAVVAGPDWIESIQIKP